jgi:hypothetical protein
VREDIRSVEVMGRAAGISVSTRQKLRFYPRRQCRAARSAVSNWQD